MLVNANLGEAVFLPDDVRVLFKGPFYDYYPEWYNDVGLKVMQTMVIGMILPIVNVVKPFAILYLK